MSDNSNNPFKFWQELKRRKVIRVVSVYAAAAFVLLELTDIIAGPLGLPGWTINLVLILLCVGFVISVILSWVFDVTPEGVQKTKSVSEMVPDKVPEKPSKIIGWKIATYASVIIIIGLVLFNIINRKSSVDLSGLDKTIAVLPFESMGGDINSALNSAIPVSLILELQKIEGFTVMSWLSTSRYSETNLSMSKIGEELDVNYILTGYTLQQDSMVQVDIEFSHSVSGESVWNDTYEKEFDIFQLRNDIAKQVASALRSNYIAEKKNLTDNKDALLAFLSGMDYYWRYDLKHHFEQAIWYFKRAIQLDPDFVQAYVQLSTSYSYMYHFHYDRTQNRLLQAKTALDKVSELDPGSPEGKYALGVYCYAIHDYEEAIDLFREVEGGDMVNKAEIILCLGAINRRQSNLKKAIEYFHQATEADPQSALLPLELGETHLLLREYDLAEKYFDKAINMGFAFEDHIINKIYLYLLWDEDTERGRIAFQENKSRLGEQTNLYYTLNKVRIDLVDGMYEDALIVLYETNFDARDHQFIYKPRGLYFAEVYQAMGNVELATAYFDSARIHLEAKIETTPLDHRLHSSLGISYAGLGRKDEAIQEGKTAVELMPIEKDFYRGIFILEYLARIYTMVGEYDQALDQIDKLLSTPSLLSVNLLKKDPVWEPLWDLPEFTELIKKYTDN